MLSNIDDENIDINLIFDENAWSEIEKLIDAKVLPKDDVYTICRYVFIIINACYVYKFVLNREKIQIFCQKKIFEYNLSVCNCA